MIDFKRYPPRDVDGTYKGHDYNATGLLKFHVDRDGDLEEGSVFEGEIVRVEDGTIVCVGYHGSMYGTYWVEVRAEECSIFEDEKHDPIWAAKQWLKSEEGKQWLKDHPLPR